MASIDLIPTERALACKYCDARSLLTSIYTGGPELEAACQPCLARQENQNPCRPDKHVFARGNGDWLVCCLCSMSIGGLTLAALGCRQESHNHRLADECGRLLEDLNAVKVENCDLRREIERLKRAKP